MVIKTLQTMLKKKIDSSHYEVEKPLLMSKKRDSVNEG